MDKLLQGDAERYASAHKRKRRWYQVTTCLAAVVVFCTTYALILPAITLEKQCALPEHTHTEACYTSERGDLTCTQSTEPQHTHTEGCYQETRDLVCGMSESTGHTHGAECYDEEGNLICGQEESQGHVHGEECYEASRQLICGQTEEPAHQHTEACYSWNQVLTCGMEEHTHSEACTATEPEEPEEPEEPVFCGKEPHTHGEDCRDEQGELTCTLEEHTHSLACYADPGADVETAEIWEQTFGDVTLTGDWRLDTLAIAQSQLGYTESTKNYVVAEDGQTLMGYTRYGAWQGDPYGDWNAMFVAFCLHYGGAENIPADKDCGSWAAALADAFLPAQSHEAAPGDLVFFDRDGDGTADRVAIVAEVTEGGFTAIEGNAEHAVGQRAYEAADSAILGYVVLPQGPKEFTLTAQSESGITVTVTGDSASLPFPASEITLTAADVAEEQGQAIREQLPAEEDTEPERRFLLDISLRHGEEEIEPVGPVTVTFSGLDTLGLYPKVYHIDTDTQTVKDMEAEKTETGDVAVVTDHFSRYAISLAAAGDLTGTINGDAFAAGGTFKLTGDVQTAENIGQVTITKDTTIDLNGHTLTISKANQCFVVESGTLTIQDSQAPAEETVDLGGSNLYGNTADLSDSTLTYYITESRANGTGTTETLIEHKVPLANAGKILCKEGSYQAIKVETDGTLELKSGVLQGTGVKHIVYVEDGTLNMTGGYIVGGGSDDQPGGGIYVTGSAVNGTVNIQGGVVAANHGNFGGGIYVVGGELTISGGAVTGNGVFNGHDDDGAGIYVNSGTLKLSGNGYVTNNSKRCECDECEKDTNNTHGGGGIALANGSKMEMTGGYVTGNFSTLAGGGIYAGYFDGPGGVNFTMSGGTIAANCAQHGEGGGLRIGGGNNGGTKGVIRTEGTVYITNNQTLTKDDWGGGGIFVQQGGLLSVMDALITNNSAEGFGGGVGACPTGETLIVNKDGAAIYDNTAEGKQMSAGGNGKDYDRSLALQSPVFMANGYTDYFCVRGKNDANNYISLVTGLMAGSGAANWKGSCDNQPVTIGKTGYAAAKYLFGLNANPDDTAKSQAVDAAKVIITGNSSGVHGGGIMTNGGLILGDPDGNVVTATPELDIIGTKALVRDGVEQTSGRNFTFQLTDDTGKVLGEATSDAATGQFTISPGVAYSQAQTRTYTLREVKGDRADVTYDNREYKIQVTVAEKTVSLLGVDFKSYYVSSVTVNGNESGGSSGSGTGPQTGPFRVRYQNTENWDNVNVYVWDDAKNKIVGDWPGKPMTKDTTDGTYYYDLTVTGAGTYNYIFNNGSAQTNDIVNIRYAPGEEAVFKFSGVVSNTATTGSTETGGVSRGANPDGSYTLVMDAPTFKNTMTTRLDLQIKKTDSVDDTRLLKDATFTLTNAKPGDNVKEATTGENGIATFENIQRGATYYLRETKAPANYMVAGPWILEVGADGNATLYPAAEKNGKLEKTSETDPGTPLTVTDGTDSKVLELPIQDTPWGYELPETGGAGTTSYTTGGLVLIFGAATLLYIHCKRRKEDEVSS